MVLCTTKPSMVTAWEASSSQNHNVSQYTADSYCKVYVEAFVRQEHETRGRKGVRVKIWMKLNFRAMCFNPIPIPLWLLWCYEDTLTG